MPRLRQRFPSNYRTNSQINGEFEQLVRYLNAAELGDKTLAELMAILFDDEGRLDAPIEMRLDTELGLQYRVGSYTDPSEGWEKLADFESLRGANGMNVGEVNMPTLINRFDFEGIGGETDIEYAHEQNDDLMVFIDGVLGSEGALHDYVRDADGGSNGKGMIELLSPLATGQTVTIFTVRRDFSEFFSRQEVDLTASQSIFSFVHRSKDEVMVLVDGLLQREGAEYDFISDPLQNTISFLAPLNAGQRLTLINIGSSNSKPIAGLMTELSYTNVSTGLIKWEKIGLADNAIGQEKVNGLIAALESKIPVYVSTTEPQNPATPSLWFYTAPAVPQMYYYDGIQFVPLNPETLLPNYTLDHKGYYLRVSPTGSGQLEWQPIDLTGLVSSNRIGAANGVAGLDSSGRVYRAQMPEVTNVEDIYYYSDGGQVERNIPLKRLFLKRARIVGVAVRTQSGTCNITATLNGSKVGGTYAASATPSEFPLATPIEVDASTSSVAIGIEIENASAPNNLEVTLVVELLNS